MGQKKKSPNLLGQQKNHPTSLYKKITHKKSRNLSGQKNHATSLDKKNQATSLDKKNHATSLDKKKSRNVFGQKKSCNLLGQKKSRKWFQKTMAEANGYVALSVPDSMKFQQ